MLLDDRIGDRQPESGPFSNRLGGEERLENFCLDLLRHSRTVVIDLDQHHLVRVVVPGTSNQRAPAVRRQHRLFGVDDQVQQHLFHLVGVGEHVWQTAGERLQRRHVRHPLLVGA